MSTQGNDSDRIRQEVSKDYARMVRNPGTGCCGTAAPKGTVAKLAKYTENDLAGLPADAVENSFGCGNPLSFSEVKEGDVVVDLGSGAGIDLLIAAKKVGPSGKVIGIDMTDEMIERARENARKAGLANIEVRKGIIEELPVETGSVDWVISNCVINLSPEKDRVFAEIARVLKPGGRMLVSDIVADGLPPEILQIAGAYSSCVAGAIGESAYLDGLRKAGLSDVEVKARLVYTAEHLKGFLDSDLPKPAESGCGCGMDLGPWMKLLEGRIQSVKVFARKPAD